MHCIAMIRISHAAAAIRAELDDDSTGDSSIIGVVLLLASLHSAFILLE